MGIKYGEETLRQSLFCGMIAGFANSYLLAPIENVKIKL
jgi:solute carrier family 25 (mitochondrial carnitine/acylcarnitine transporter), member 20/29